MCVLGGGETSRKNEQDSLDQQKRQKNNSNTAATKLDITHTKVVLDARLDSNLKNRIFIKLAVVLADKGLGETQQLGIGGRGCRCGVDG